MNRGFVKLIRPIWFASVLLAIAMAGSQAFGKGASHGHPPLTAVGPFDQTNCPGSRVVFSTAASGAGHIRYQWFKNHQLLPGETKADLALTNVSASDAAVYQVMVSGVRRSVTNSATLSLYESAALSAMAILVRNVGESATFDVVASGSGPFTYVWKKDNAVIAGQTGSSLTLSNITFADDGAYTVEVTGQCNTAGQSAALHVNIPPAVNLFSPTNGTRLVVPANFTLAANAQDIDGSVTNVEFFDGTNKVGETSVGNPFILVLIDVAVGSHTYTARATDDNGAASVSTPVSVLVLDSPPLTGGVSSAVFGIAPRLNRAFAMPDRNFLIEFMSASNRIYRIQYSSNLSDWKTVPIPVAGNGTWIQWIDKGQPRTESAPSATDTRFYRVIALP